MPSPLIAEFLAMFGVYAYNDPSERKEPVMIKSGFMSFLMGMAKVLDIGGNLQVYHTPVLNIPDASFFIDDTKALEADWIVVGNDLRAAMTEFKEQHAEAS
jgi:hypothetical protein